MSEIVFRGYLHKSPPESFGSSLKPWRLRWFILADSRLAFPLASPYVRLEYYASEQFANDLNEPKGVIDLKDCIEVVDHHRPMKGYDHVFGLCTDKRDYHFAAPSMEMKSVWMQSLNAVLQNTTESSQRDATVNLSMGAGNNAGDMSMVSPIYSSLQRCANASEDQSAENDKYIEMNRRKENKPVPTSVENSDTDDYQHLQHRRPNDVHPLPVNSGNSAHYDSLARSFLQDVNDDYQHLDHKKHNQNGAHVPTVTTSTSLYGRLNREDDVDDYQHLDHKRHNQNGGDVPTVTSSTSLYGRLNREDDNYHRLNHHRPATITSIAANSSQYGTLNLDMKDDYQRLDNCTLHKGDYQSNGIFAARNDNYSQPRVPAIPARKHTYENHSGTPTRAHK